MTEITEITFWIAINHEGEFVLNKDGATDAVADLETENHNEAVRVIEMKVKVPLPQPVVVEATIPEETGTPTVTIG